MKVTRLLAGIGGGVLTRAGGGRQQPSGREENETNVHDTFQGRKGLKWRTVKEKISISFVSTPTSTILTLTI